MDLTMFMCSDVGCGRVGAKGLCPHCRSPMRSMKTPVQPRCLVYLESPFAGDRERNAAYLKACMRDSLDRGEAPFASHALYAQFLDDSVPEERAVGIEAGLAWGLKAARTVVYMDLGISPGMQQRIDRAHAVGRPVEQRLLRWTYVPEKLAVCFECQTTVAGEAQIRPIAIPTCSRCKRACVGGHWLLDNPDARKGADHG